MKIRHPWLIRLASVLAALFVKALMFTMCFRLRGWGQIAWPDDPRLSGPHIYAFWHDSLLFLTAGQARARFCVLASQSADGELIAQVVLRLGHRVARGSSSRGGSRALHELLAQAKRGHLAVTPDGPRGPRRTIKPGIIYLASCTGLPIIPLGIAYAKAWRARTWDRFGIPYPFSTVAGISGRILHVPPNLDRLQLEHYRQELQNRMLEATTHAEAWMAQKRGGKMEKTEAPAQMRRAA